MTFSEPARTTARRVRGIFVIGLLAGAAASAAALGHELSESSPVTVKPRSDTAPAFDGGSPRASKLDPELSEALRRARADAAIDGIRIVVNSGRRSPEHQEQLLRDAIHEFGSEAEAARWVATPETSPHVSGDAIDIGPSDATSWLAERGSAYGLCQIYGNETWHFELRPEAADQGCPAMYPDPTYDPRMQK